MATIGRFTRAIYPRWMTSKSVEVSPGSTIIDDDSDRSVAVNLLPSTLEHESPSMTPTPTVDKLRGLLKTSVVNVSRHITSSQSVRQSKKSDNDHSIVPGQSLADAMSECHSSVNQYYGLATNQSETIIDSQPTEGKKNRQLVTIASKKARIGEAKHNRLSVADTERKMKSLTINAVTPDISIISRATRLKELREHAKNNPSARHVAINQGVVPFLLSLLAEDRKSREKHLADSKRLRGLVNETLAVLGHTPSISSKGIRILTIDGGGTRGLVAIETLKQLEILCGAPIYTMFDYICGVSTGGLLAVLLGPLKLPLDRCEQVYKECSQKLFNRSTIAGTANLLTKHSYYDMTLWEGILRSEVGETTMLSTARDEKCPRISLVSTVMADLPYNYVFRNYNHDINSSSQYPGSCNAKVWQAIRASSAAPGYFEDFKIGHRMHQDGGVLNNNPTAIALHEAKALWPEEKVQCVVSVGNGRYEPGPGENIQDITSLRHKLGAFIHSATNTEDVHTVLNDLLPVETYYRFNPYMSEEFLLNEIQDEKLQQMQFDTQQYLRRNASKINKAGQQLKVPRTAQQKIHDWMSNKYSTLTNRVPASH